MQPVSHTQSDARAAERVKVLEDKMRGVRISLVCSNFSDGSEERGASASGSRSGDSERPPLRLATRPKSFQPLSQNCCPWSRLTTDELASSHAKYKQVKEELESTLAELGAL